MDGLIFYISSSVSIVINFLSLPNSFHPLFPTPPFSIVLKLSLFSLFLFLFSSFLPTHYFLSSNSVLLTTLNTEMPTSADLSLLP